MKIQQKLNKGLRKEQSGRSMVEMLGVLAIIGVLSIGGVAGYSTAMKRHRLNEIMRKTTLLFMDINTNLDMNDRWINDPIKVNTYLNDSSFVKDLRNTSGVRSLTYSAGGFLHLSLQLNTDQVDVEDWCEYVKSINDLYYRVTPIPTPSNCQGNFNTFYTNFLF